MADALQAGTAAPDFALQVDARPDASRLSDFRGRPVILAFYPADWSPVCGDQMALYNESCPSSSATAPSCSASRSTASGATAFAQDRKLHFPLLADFEPKGEVARQYGVYRDETGISERALFVHRRRRRDPLELRLADRRQPRRRRHPRRARGDGTAKAGRHDVMTEQRPTPDRPGRASATTSGARRRAGHAGRVRRLRVPVLRRGVPDRQGGASGCSATSCASSSATSRCANIHPHAEHAAEAAEAAGGAGQVLGDARPALRAPGRARRPRPAARYAERARPRRRRASRRELRGARARDARARGLPERRAQRRQRHADVLHQRRAPRRRLRPAESLVEALRREL